MTTLQPNDILQSGDLIQRVTKYNGPGASKEPSHSRPQPCATCTLGRTILPADLVAATYFRP